MALLSKLTALLFLILIIILIISQWQINLSQSFLANSCVSTLSVDSSEMKFILLTLFALFPRLFFSLVQNDQKHIADGGCKHRAKCHYSGDQHSVFVEAVVQD